jgi:tetratricopeptide (TPR) repeat protein
MIKWRSFAWASLAACLACHKPAPPPATVRPAPLEPRTTSGSIAQRNLDSQIESAGQDVTRKPSCASCKAALANLLLTRAQFFGRVLDYDRAATLADEAVRLQPAAQTYLARAHVRAALHQFPLARQDLASALSAGAPADEAALLTASIDDAVGETRAALDSVRALNQRSSAMSSLGEEAILRGEEGDTTAAAKLFAKARAAYRDVSPMPLAFLELQEGLMWERVGNTTAAQERFETAHRRLPTYVAAASHLAGVTPDIDAAMAMLEPLAESEDPEPSWQLAQLLTLRGNAARSKALVEKANAAYEALLARHPEAFADHAARFWLGPGGKPAEALTWARKNAAWRATAASDALWIEAALAAGAGGEACQTVEAARSHHWFSPALDDVLRRAGSRCGVVEARR